MRLGAHWCDFQSQVALWKVFVRLCKTIKRQKLGKIYWKNLKNCKIWHFQKIYAKKCNKNCLGGQKMCAFYHKCGAFWGKINCAPFCALFGSIMCAFEFRIIRHSEHFIYWRWFYHLHVAPSRLFYIPGNLRTRNNFL